MFNVKHRKEQLCLNPDYTNIEAVLLRLMKNDDIYIKSSNIPLTLRTSEVFDSEMWEEMEDKNGCKNT